MKKRKYGRTVMKNGLVLNEEHANSRFNTLTCNLVPSACRVDTLEGRDYLVVPMVILTEGVHNGSNGPLYYPKEELAKTPVVWNHKPIVVYHPTMNGQGISACDPTVINNRKVGLMLNTRFENGKLKSEAWIETARANTVDERIMAAIEAKEMMELSTGVFTDNEDKEGTWNGETYVGIARNYRPDHLALLPDQIGACSIKDGAGLLRNTEKPQAQAFLQIVTRALAQAGLTDNEMSFSNIRESLSTLLRKKFPAPNTDMGPGVGVWVEDVYSNFVVYEKGGKLFRIGYTNSDTGVALSDETPVEVKRVTEYRTVEGAFVGNRDHQPVTNQQQTSMNKKELVDAIITGNLGWAEADREKLMALTDNQVQSIHKGLTPPAPAPAKVEPAAPAVPATTNAPAKPEPKPENVITVQGYIANAPKEIQEVLNNGLSSYQEEKSKLVASIQANANNGFTPEELNTMPLGQLKNLARLAFVPAAPAATQPNYSGQAPVPVGNTGVEEPLEIPAMNFAAK